jgi:hypothetical protein
MMKEEVTFAVCTISAFRHLIVPVELGLYF